MVSQLFNQASIVFATTFILIGACYGTKNKFFISISSMDGEFRQPTLVSAGWRMTLDLERNGMIESEIYKDQDFTSTPLRGSDFDSCEFIGCIFSEVQLGGKKFLECTFHNCEMSGVKVQDTAFRECTFSDCKLMGSTLTLATLSSWPWNITRAAWI